MTRSPARACVLCVALAAASSTAHSQELIENGGFETGSFLPWLAPPSIPNQSVFRISGNGAHAGKHYAKMSSSTLQYVSQLLSTSAGQDYELRFWLRRPTNAPAGFVVRWEGQFVFAQSLVFQPPFEWREFDFPLHSNIAGSLLEFGQMDFPGEFHIDDISVVPVPAPSAAALLGMTGLLTLSRRPRRGAP